MIEEPIEVLEWHIQCAKHKKSVALFEGNSILVHEAEMTIEKFTDAISLLKAGNKSGS